MTRESVSDNARRYLTEARITITAVDGDHVTATCRGAGVYSLGHQPGRGWHCSCLARTDRCAHLLALQFVTVRRAGAIRPDGLPKEPPRVTCVREHH